MDEQSQHEFDQICQLSETVQIGNGLRRIDLMQLLSEDATQRLSMHAVYNLALLLQSDGFGFQQFLYGILYHSLVRLICVLTTGYDLEIASTTHIINLFISFEYLIHSNFFALWWCRLGYVVIVYDSQLCAQLRSGFGLLSDSVLVGFCGGI
jgi:hypothetical protein